MSDRYSVPMVLVVVEGGPNTLKTVREFLVGGCPVRVRVRVRIRVRVNQVGLG